ncbi:MAG: 4-hydroxy-3-methylbut-2-enyl diphosphate reductase [Candidatus Omnitrophica bacterium]|nr:4-hydroxy-3-methylbut-2-enyl diphosphate reductase [Candidatus Omnitrophota bacterium]
MQIFLARTQGFCAGVARAITTVDQALLKFGTPLYVFHEIVHNTAVVDDFRRRGVIFVDDLNNVPDGSRLIFSAHGVSPAIIETARRKHLKTIDATCPLVTKVHHEAAAFSSQDVDVILIGHKGHEEVVGTSGYVKPGLLHIVQNAADIENMSIPAHKKVAFITQTTLSIDAARELILKLRARFPRLTGPLKDDICYATQNRQDAVKELAALSEVIIICGSPKSSNSNRLREKGEHLGRPSYIVDNASELDLGILNGKTKVGISSGASVPRHLVDAIIAKIQAAFSPVDIITFDDPEQKIIFPNPEI